MTDAAWAVRSLVVASLLVWLAPTPGRAQTSASAAVGVGMLGGQPAAAVDVGVEVTRDELALGLGGRVRWLAGDGVRGDDWDEASEVARVVRYATYRRAAVAAALGELGGAVLGHGAVFAGYAAGLDIDHGHLGLQLRAGDGDDVLTGEALIDDVVAPRLVGARAAWRAGGPARFGLTMAGDVAAPAAGGAALVPFVVVDGELASAAEAARRGRLYVDLVGVPGLAAGLHLGAAGELRPRDARLGARLELRAGSGGYLAGWMGPLYEVTRRVGAAGPSLLDRARAGGLGGVGALAELSADDPTLGTAELSYAVRPGLADLATARAAAPYWRGVQGALWAAIEPGGTWACAAELRARLPGHLFAAVEAARLFRDQDGAPAAVWVTTLSVGAVVGD